MALRPITEQQFRTRRKDRRMVWVDAAAVLVGAVMLVATVGGVVFVEPEPKPFEWDYSFFEALTKHKHCAGVTSVREGCTQIVDPRRPNEGDVIQTIFDPVQAPNVTSVRFTLGWIDNTPVTERPDCQGHLDGECDRSFSYDEESVDLLRLTVWPPTGDPITIEGTNDVNTKSGSIALVWDFLAMPESGSVFGFSEQEAMAQVVPQFTNPEHEALGEWRAEVIVVDAGDQQGSVPINPCFHTFGEANQSAPEPLVDPLAEHCYTDEHQDTVEDDAIVGPAMPGGGWESSFDDDTQVWILEMAIRSYDSQVTVA